MKNIYLISIFLLTSFMTYNTEGQEPQPNFNLKTHESGNRNYLARDKIVLSDGFSYKATTNESFSARIDQYLLFPPSDKTYKTPEGDFTEDKSEGSVVGRIPGSLNVSPAGAAVYQIPIECPPGINGMEPSLSIVYNSQGGIGLAGYNFNLTGISCIERTNHSYCYDSDSHPVSFDGKDRFALDGRRLVLISGSYGSDGSVYGFEVEDFSRTISYGKTGDGPAWFKVEMKDGRIMEFGKTSDSKMVLSGNTGIYKWYLNKIMDQNGNYIKYTYASKDDGETWISKIEYGGNSNSSASPACSIEFLYYSMKELGLNSGSLPMYIAGNGFSRTKFLKGILAKSSSKIYRKYGVKYETGSLKTPFLKSVEVKDRNDEKLPETVFEWGNTSISSKAIPDIEAEKLITGDFTGDGIDNIAKIVYNSSSHKYSLNILDLNGNTWRVVKRGEIGQCTDVEIYNCSDFNNDGVDDLIVKDKIKVYAGQTPWRIRAMDGATCKFFNINLPQKLNHKPVSGDFNGNGYNNSVLFTDSYVYLLENKNYRRLGFSDNLSFNTIEDVYSGDFNGDEKSDLLIKRDNDLKLYSLEGSRFTLKKTINKKVSKCCIGDLNGDGISDLVAKTEDLNIYYFSNFEIVKTSTDFPKFSLPVKSSYYGEDNKVLFRKSSGPNWWSSDPVLISDANVLSFSSNGRSGILLNGVVYADYLGQLENVESFNDWLDGRAPSDALWKKYQDYHKPERQAWEKKIEALKAELTKDGLLYDIWKNNIGYVFPGYTYTLRVYHQGFNYLQRSSANLDHWVVQKEERRNFSFEDIDDVLLVDFSGAGRKYLTLIYGEKEGDKTMSLLSSFFDISKSQAVTSIKDGTGNKTAISYGPLISKKGETAFYTREKSGTYPVYDVAGDFRVVSKVNMPDGEERTYFYRGAKVHQSGKGFLGFKKIIMRSSKSGIEAENQYSVVDNLNILVPSQQTSNLISGSLIRANSNVISPVSSGGGYFLRHDKRTVTDYLKMTTITENFSEYDEDGNLKKKTVNYGGGISITTETTSFVQKGGRCKNKPSNLIVTNKNGSETQKRKTLFEYDEKGNLTRKTIDPGDRNELVTNFKNYNIFGLPELIENIANNEKRSTEIKYSSSGRFIKRKTDKLKGAFVEYKYRKTTGLPEYEFDDRNRRTTYEYDGFGRLIRTTFPTGVHSVNVLQWAGGDGPDGAKYYTYRETSGQSPVWTWYDCFDREIRVDYYGLDSGKKISVSTNYNSKGLVGSVSEPYFTGGQKNGEESYSYDGYGRLKTKSTPMGETSILYSGSKIKTTTPRGSREQKYNSAGQLVSSNVDGKTVGYTYWPSGKLKTATPEGGMAVQSTYDLQGNRTKIIDPDAGTIESKYNGFGELTKETRKIHNTGKQEIITKYEYERGGLPDYIDVNGEKTDYEYDQYERLTGVAIDGQHSQTFEYDDYDRLIKLTEVIENRKTFVSEKRYDKYGRISKEIYPTGYSVSKTYNRYGVLKNITDSKGKNIWTAVKSNPRGQLTKLKKGGRELTYGYDSRGLPDYIKSSGIVDQDYNFFDGGNLESCKDNLSKQKEEFLYDKQNRLTDWLIYDKDNNLVKTNYVTYNSNAGNITNKTGIGYEMIYGENNKGPHAITSIKGKPSAFPDNRQTITYTDFSKVKKITEGNNSLSILYGVDNQRRKVVLKKGQETLTRYYHQNFEEEVKGSNSRKIHYISTGGDLAAIYVQEGGKEKLYYPYTDYLGSLIAITDDGGKVVERLAYDPWGQRRNPSDWALNITTPVSHITGRGYTMHEHLDDFALINMNGRVYDPQIASFLSPDPFVQAPGQWMNYNRYSYCFNNPLIYTDPTGMRTMFGRFFHWVGTGANNAYDWFWDTTEQLGRFLDKKGFSVNIGGGINSAQGPYIESGGHRQYVNQIGVNPADNVNRGINDARKNEAYLQGNTPSLRELAANSGDGWHPPMALPSGKDVLDATSGALSHPATSIGLQFGDDALRAIGLAKAIPGINIAANAAGAYVYTSDMSNPNLSFERKAYRTVSNGVPLVLGTGAMIGAFGSGAGEAAVIIGAVGYAGEQVYDHAIQPALWYISGKVVEFETWFKSGGYNSMYSDQNLKGNIVPIDSSLNKLLQINGYNFEWKDGIAPEEGHDIGLLAQEIERVYPELVVSDSAGYKKIYYYKLIPVMVEAIKEQQRTIDSQNVLLINYQKDIKENEELLNAVLIRLEELEKGKKKKNK